MKKAIIFILFTILSHEAIGQNEVDIRSSAYVLGKQYYNNKDYFTAYRYLLAYKYTYYELLIKPENEEMLRPLNNALTFCESKIKKGLSGSVFWEGSSYFKSEEGKKDEQKLNEKSNEKPPILPTKHF